MSTVNDINWLDDENDPLVARLRTMGWGEAPADVRERCWDQLQQRLEALKAVPAPELVREAEPEPEPLRPKRLNEFDRLTFTVRLEPRRPTLADRWAQTPRRAALAH